MKRLLFFAVALILTLGSCSLSDDGVNFHYAPLEIVSVNVPDTFEFGQLYTIDVNILRPDDCTLTDEFDVRRSFTDTTQIRTIAAIGIILDKDECAEVNQEIQDSFDFEVRYTDPYIFKFYTGIDENDDPQFLEVEVPVKAQP